MKIIMGNPIINTILIFNLHITYKFVNNNCKSEGCEMQRSEDDLSRLLAKSPTILVSSSWVFT
jgi:hypothetical protein